MILDDLGQFFHDHGYGTVGQDIWLGGRDDSPDEAISIVEYPGRMPTYVQEGVSHSNPQVQVMVRGTSYNLARLRAQGLWDLLATINNQTIGDGYYLSIRPQGDPALLGRDHLDRVMIGFNLAVSKGA